MVRKAQTPSNVIGVRYWQYDIGNIQLVCRSKLPPQLRGCVGGGKHQSLSKGDQGSGAHAVYLQLMKWQTQPDEPYQC